ncbi:MAG: ABC transporter substrate-binding protein [Lachnospiraceae bacterium]|nr:ABC transporter substrate-binding protein [Lachnospiraceae bacterium]
MKNGKKLLALLAAASMTVLTACGTVGGQAAAEAPAAEEPKTEEAAPAQEQTEETADSAEAAEGESYLVGICQLVQHPALDAATQGFKDALTEALGDAVSFDEQNAAGDAATAATICTNLVSENVDLILANATPALQAAAAATGDIPILGTSITEYGVALELSDFNGTVGTNVSVTSDLPPLDQQAAMVTELIPDAKTVGILYCSAEPNSKYQADVVEKCLEDAGLTVTIYTFSDSNDVAAVTGEACANSDVLYIPTDNTAASCTEAINNVAQPAGVPIIAGEEGIMQGCGVATLSISYYDLGVTTGQMAVKILTGESNVSEMPIEYYPNPVKEYNPAIAEALGIDIPDDYVAVE